MCETNHLRIIGSVCAILLWLTFTVQTWHRDLVPYNYFMFPIGLQAEGSLRSDSRAPPTHCQRLLEDGVGTGGEVYCHAVQDSGRQNGML